MPAGMFCACLRVIFSYRHVLFTLSTYHTGETGDWHVSSEISALDKRQLTLQLIRLWLTIGI